MFLEGKVRAKFNWSEADAAVIKSHWDCPNSVIYGVDSDLLRNATVRVRVCSHVCHSHCACACHPHHGMSPCVAVQVIRSLNAEDSTIEYVTKEDMMEEGLTSDVVSCSRPLWPFLASPSHPTDDVDDVGQSD